MSSTEKGDEVINQSTCVDKQKAHYSTFGTKGDGVSLRIHTNRTAGRFKSQMLRRQNGLRDKPIFKL
jgi:hypothetical protein